MILAKTTARMLLTACVAGGAILAPASAAPPTADEMRALLKSRPEIDEIHWKDPSRGAPFTVRVLEASATAGLTVEKRLASGMTLRKLPLADIGSIHFGLTPPEAGLHDNPEAAAAPALQVLWESRKAAIALPGSNAAETGLACAKALRAAAAFDEADGVLTFIIAKDPLESRVALSRTEQAALAFVRSRQTGPAEETDRLAWRIVEDIDGENTDAILLAASWLADRHFSQLKAIEEDNPRWIEDTEIKPQRDRLYHLALDFALYPSLFESRDAEASAGLAKAAFVYQFTGENAALKGVLEDLAALYPDSPETTETSPLLAALRQADATLPRLESKTGDDSETTGQESPVGAPPPAKRYNLFED